MSQTAVPAPELTLIEAVRAALIDEMERDQRVMVLGMDVGRLGGVFRATAGLQERFGPERVVDTPLAEASIVGSALGLAVGGMVPVAEIQFLGFAHQASHQIGPQLARYRFLTRGRHPVQVTIRAPFGGGSRTPEFHPDSMESQFSQAPGLKVVCPAFPADAYGLLLAAIRDPDPVLFMEPQAIYRTGRETVVRDGRAIELGHARLVRPGTDLTLIAWGAGVHLCLQAADRLVGAGASVGVLDLRSISPLDVESLVAEVSASGKAVVVQEAPLSAGFAAEVVATLQQEAFLSLDAPIARVAAPDTPYPPGSLEDYYLPSLDRLLVAAQRTLAF